MSDQTCALCSGTGPLTRYDVAPRDSVITLCATCLAGVTAAPQDAPHWRCLGDAIWSDQPAVQVVAWRMLTGLKANVWASDLLDQAYLEPDVQAWAEAGLVTTETVLVHRDSNGAVLVAGDTVTLIKDLVVKGAGFTAKRGTAVRGISLVQDNADQIEGRVNGQQIVLLCQYLKKST
jgi:protein PhnA